MCRAASCMRAVSTTHLAGCPWPSQVGITWLTLPGPCVRPTSSPEECVPLQAALGLDSEDPLPPRRRRRKPAALRDDEDREEEPDEDAYAQDDDNGLNNRTGPM